MVGAKEHPPLSVSPDSKSSVSISFESTRAVTGTQHQRFSSVCVTACNFENESPMSDKISGFP
eukprot:1486711-Rhodomonas_salina.2